jgi:cytidine deaminase
MALRGYGEDTLRKLVDACIAAKKNSYSPYSKFRVGACLLGKSGAFYPGNTIPTFRVSKFQGATLRMRPMVWPSVQKGQLR